MEDDDATVWLDDNDDPNSSILPFINPSKWLEEFTMEVEDVEDSCTAEVEEDCMVDADLVTASISSFFSSIKASICPEFTVEEEDS